MKTFLLILIGAATWAYVVGFAFAQPVDLGGNVWARMNAPIDTRPISGVCASACTVRLATASCIDAEALLGFHQASYDGRRSDLATLMLTTHYTPALRKWFGEGGQHVRWLSGRSMAKFGYKVC